MEMASIVKKKVMVGSLKEREHRIFSGKIENIELIRIYGHLGIDSHTNIR
jgi:hypothetical protein